MTYIVAERAADLIRDSWKQMKSDVYLPESYFPILYMFESFMSKVGKKCIMIVWLLEGKLRQAW